MYPGGEPASSKTHEKVTFKVKLITNTEAGKLRQNKMTETAGQSRKEKLGTNLKKKNSNRPNRTNTLQNAGPVTHQGALRGWP